MLLGDDGHCGGSSLRRATCTGGRGVQMSAWSVDIVIILSIKHHLQGIVASLASSVPLAITETSGTGGPQMTMVQQCIQCLCLIFWLLNPESAPLVISQ